MGWMRVFSLSPGMMHDIEAVWMYDDGTDHSKLGLVADLVDVVIEQLVDQVHVRQEHPPATVPAESQLIQYLPDIYFHLGVSILVALAHLLAELLPLVRDHLAAAEATYRDYHVEIAIILQGRRFELQMRPTDKKLEGKVGKYREEKVRAGKLESFMSEKRRNIEKLMQEHTIQPEPQLDLQKFANDIDLKHQRYLDDMSALEDTRMAIIEARGTLEGLQLELSLQEQSLQALRKTAAREVGSQEEVLSQLRGRLQGQRAQRAKMEQERCQRQLDHVQKLTNQKEELIGRTEEMLRKRKGLDLALKKLKENFEEDYKTQRQQWLRVQNQRREKWQAKKQQEINEGTLKSIQPQIARIVGAGKQEIAKLQHRYESIRNEYAKEMNLQFEDNLRMIRNDITQRVEADTAETAQRIGEQQRKLMERLAANFEGEKGRLKIGKEAQVRQLQSRRKKQAQQFMVRNKDYLLSHLGEVKQVKANYESEIRQLDGSLDKQLWKQQAAIKERWQKKAQAHRDQKRKQLQAKVRAFHIQQKNQSESLYEDIVQRVAVENQTIDSELRRQTDAKIRQYKQNHQAELKCLRKQLQVLMSKQRKEQQAMRGVKQARESIQQQHEQLTRENQYLRKKEIQFQAEVVRLKAKEDDYQSAQEKDLSRIKQQWQEQLDLLQKKIAQTESQMQAQERIMGEKQEQERGKIIGMMNKLEKEGVLLVKKLNEDIQRARRERGVKMTLSGKLAEMKKKLKDMEAKRRK